MKFMKLGTRLDTFHTEEAVRTLVSDVPSDLVVQINNFTYLLHKFPLLPKCGLLQRLCSDAGDSEKLTVQLHDIPGGEDAFELCAKFCYGITINLSAHNFVYALCAAKFLRMSESVERGNFVTKLEAFFLSCILSGWKDSIVTLRSTVGLSEWSQNLGITRQCIDSIVEKILSPTSKVSWSYTYTRPGYSKKSHRCAPKDWWTEDVADVEVDLFRCIIMTITSSYTLPPQLIGEALHVYAYRWLPENSKPNPQTEQHSEKHRKVLQTIVSLIPPQTESVSVKFLLRLLSIANYVGASKKELIRRSSMLLEDATVSDLLFPSHSSSDDHFFDVDLVMALLESFLMLSSEFLTSIRKVGKLIDSYLQVIARDRNMPVSKMIYLAEALPEHSRQSHDDIYKAINIFLKEHPDLSKADKKRLCRVMNCQKLSPEVRAHAVKNERLPLRTVVQILFLEQEKSSKASSRVEATGEVLHRPKQRATTSCNLSEIRVRPDERFKRSQSTRAKVSETSEKDEQRMMTTELLKQPHQSRRKVIDEGDEECATKEKHNR